MGRKSRKILSFLLIFALTLGSLTGLLKANVKAAQGVEVIVNGITGKMFAGESTKLNPVDALKEVTAGKVTASGDYVTGINGLNAGDYGGSSGWMYSLYRNGAYTSPYPLTLEDGDVLVYYYGDLSTLLPNDVKLSTTLPNTSLTITINNIDWENKTNSVNGAVVKIDGAAVPVSGNTVAISSGLPEGVHTINISGYNAAAVPSIAEVTYTVNIAYPKINVELYGLNGLMGDGQVSLSPDNKTALSTMKSFLSEKGIHYTVTKTWAEYISEIGGITEKSLNSQNHDDGWQYYIKKSDKIISPQVGTADYNMSEGETLVMYYGIMATKYLYSIKFNPEIVKPNQSFTAQFIAQDGTPIQNTEVKIDGKSYTSDNYGKISAVYLASGSHSYTLSFKKDSTIPEVIGTSGSFTIDGVHSPNFNYASDISVKPEDQDNSGLKVNIDQEIGATSPYIKANGNNSYSAMSMKALGIDVNKSFLKEYEEDIEKYGAADYANTDLETLILGITAAGYLPYSFGNCDLVKTLLNRDINTFQINDLIFALNVYNYVKPAANYKITKDIIIDKIISKKAVFTDKNYNSIYGFTLAFDKDNPSIDPDITAMAITALAPYYSQAKVKAAIDSSVNSLKIMENDSGYIIGSYGVSSETQSAVIMALTAVGIDPRGEDFSKTKGDLVTALLSFKGTNGQFKHSLDGTNNLIATEQSLRALISYYYFIKNGSYNYYAGNESLSLNEYKDLPKTGEALDFSVMMLSGIIAILIGFALIKKKKVII